MDAVKDLALILWDDYQWALSISDKRVSNWPLMSAYWPTVAITVTYLIIVYVGPSLMKCRPRGFQFSWSLFWFNAGLVALNFYIFFELLTASVKLNYSWRCQLVDYSDHPDEMRIAKAIWWFYISKLVELLDTVVFILRKKNSQVSFLHVFHHASMFLLWWIGVKWVAGGLSCPPAMVNSFVHVLMYTYYGLSALGPKMQKYLWWKKYLTRIQLAQFFLMMALASRTLYTGCEFPHWMQWAFVAYGSIIILLFLNFYIQTYIRSSKANAKSKES